MKNADYRTLIESVYKHANHSGEPAREVHKPAVEYLNYIHRDVDETYGLGLMPVLCGDLALEHGSEEMRRRARSLPSRLKASKGDAPLISKLNFTERRRPQLIGRALLRF